MGPGKRLALISFQMVFAVHSANRAAGSMNRTTEPSEELRKEAEDL